MRTLEGWLLVGRFAICLLLFASVGCLSKSDEGKAPEAKVLELAEQKGPTSAADSSLAEKAASRTGRLPEDPLEEDESEDGPQSVDDDIVIDPGEDFNSSKNSGGANGDLGTLPLPEVYTSVGLEKFMLKYQIAYKVYEPLFDEWNFTLNTFKNSRGLEDEHAVALRERINDTPERAHWTFCFGVYETLRELSVSQRQQVLYKQEKLFLARMKILLFFAKENDKAFAVSAYSRYVKALYIDVNSRMFGRELRGRKGRK